MSAIPRRTMQHTVSSQQRNNIPSATTHLKKELLEEQKQEIREAFNLFDMNNDGFLDFHELKVAIKALGFEYSKQEVLQLIHQYDRDERNLMHYEDFFAIMGEKVLNRDPLEEIRRAFRLFDEDNTGKISLRNLRKVAKELGENLTDEELRAMIDEFDLDNDGESMYTCLLSDLLIRFTNYYHLQLTKKNLSVYVPRIRTGSQLIWVFAVFLSFFSSPQAGEMNLLGIQLLLVQAI
ncbi:hypothetical protein WICPIJ_008247 [Wickerhamomyces pijperi]|uniref:EF-hand domain-containing protein n=1 Tax=Wickerhamomyces pijperi TaxID=599730 RepID=A0A9P8TJF7_WICPI|nr:hypothetical protein WICPIJ_008247 [Wickerhamomyces pijperi]